MQKRNLTSSFSVLFGTFLNANLIFLSNLFLSVMFCDLNNVGSITRARGRTRSRSQRVAEIEPMELSEK